MSGILTPGERTSVWGEIGDLFRRVTRLEATPPGGTGSGIQFDIDNIGGSLLIDANDPIPTTDNAIVINANNGYDLELNTVGGGNLTMDATTVGITAGSFNFVDAQVTVGSLSVNGLRIRMLAAGGVVVIEDSGGNPVFQVDEDATVHIKTGQTIVADL